MPSRSRDEFEFVAIAPIRHGGVLAYAVGDTVHADVVASQGYVVGEQVTRRDTGPRLVGEHGPEILRPADPGEVHDTGEHPRKRKGDRGTA